MKRILTIDRHCPIRIFTLFFLSGLHPRAETLSYSDWRVKYFGSSSAPDSGENDDYDRDAHLNFAEYLASTDPTNSSHFWDFSYQTNSSGDLWQFRFPSVSGRSILIEHSTDLENWSRWNADGNSADVVSLGEPGVVTGSTQPENMQNSFRFKFELGEHSRQLMSCIQVVARGLRPL